MDRQRMRSPLARAMGLGSAKDGVEHWWMERVSAVALVPLTLWFVASIIAHTGSDYATFIAWLRTPLATILMILLLIALFYHTALGLQVVIEDYVHSGAQICSAGSGAPWLLRTRRRRNRGHLAHRLWRLRGTVHTHKKHATKAAKPMAAASAQNGCVDAPVG